MKKKFLCLSILGIFLLSSCDMNEEPQSSASVNMVFSSAKGLETYAYSFYNDLPNYSSAFKQDATSDYSAKNQIGGMEVGAYTTNSSLYTKLKHSNPCRKLSPNTHIQQLLCLSLHLAGWYIHTPTILNL